MKPFSVLQWNCYHLNSEKIHYLATKALQENIDVIMIQEVSHVDYKYGPRRIPNFQKPMFLKPEHAKGIAVYVRNGVQWKFVTECYNEKYPKILHQAILVGHDETDILRIDHVYIHPETTKPDREQFWNYITSNKMTKHLILGDIN